MNFQIFSIYDSKAGSHLPPFFLPTKEMATRTFSDCCNESDHAFCQHPADYTLFHHGEFDGDTAEYTLFDGIKNVGNGLDFQHTHTLSPEAKAYSVAKNGTEPILHEVTSEE